MSRSHLLAGLAFLAAAIPGSAFAAAIPSTHAATGVPTRNTPLLTGAATTGAGMAGMQVTVQYADGGTEMAVWATTGLVSGAAAGTGWRLRLDGDSFANPWILENVGAPGIVGLGIAGASGLTAFDIVGAGDPPPGGSPGSADGRPFGDVEDIGPSGVAAADGFYSDGLQVAGTFHGDLYTTLNILLIGNLAAGETLRYLADTDTFSGQCCGPVPEPAALTLFGLGLAGLGLVRRRRA